MKQPIYLDYASTTPVDPRVAEDMMQHLTLDGVFGNPASRSHKFGWQAEEAVEAAREQVANLINADPREIVFTSGATESNNLALKGLLQANAPKGGHIITMTTEHKAVLDTCATLEKNGHEVTYLQPKSDGLLDIDQLQQAMREDTVLVSVMQVNNETGVIQDIAQIAKICAERDIYYHVDAAQSVGKLSIDVQELPVHLMSFSAGKIYGPKGIGALYVRRRPKVQLTEQINGGGHERGMRSGTLATHQIVGIGRAFAIAGEEMQQEQQRIAELRRLFVEGIADLGGIVINGHQTHCIPGIVNVSFHDVEGESLLMALKDIAVSTGSACTSASLEPSYVLTEMGVSPELAHSSVRFSFGRFTTEAHIETALDNLYFAVPRLRELA
ncbi:MAG: IscS subfamily cysteine desulfurase [Aestuariibacter sp.]